MHIATSCSEPFAKKLDQRQSARILEVAVRSQAHIELEPNQTVCRTPLAGIIVSQAPESFCIALDESIEPQSTELVSVCCHAWLHVGDDRYLFSTNIMAVVDTDVPIRLEIARPDIIHATERRRFHRTMTQPTSSVRLYRTDGDFDASGILLNAGVGGISCRLAAEDADETNLEEILQASFQLAGEPEWFDLAAVVRNKTQARSADQIIVGMEFRFGADDEKQRIRLVDALGFGSSIQSRSCDHE